MSRRTESVSAKGGASASERAREKKKKSKREGRGSKKREREWRERKRAREKRGGARERARGRERERGRKRAKESERERERASEDYQHTRRAGWRSPEAAAPQGAGALKWIARRERAARRKPCPTPPDTPSSMFRRRAHICHSEHARALHVCMCEYACTACVHLRICVCARARTRTGPLVRHCPRGTPRHASVHVGATAPPRCSATGVASRKLTDPAG